MFICNYSWYLETLKLLHDQYALCQKTKLQKLELYLSSFEWKLSHAELKELHFPLLAKPLLCSHQPDSYSRTESNIKKKII